MDTWKCAVCGYRYDEAVGEPLSGASPGTLFDALPFSWQCPVCHAGKVAFRLLPGVGLGSMPLSTVAEVMVDELARFGVTLVLAVPGTSSLGIIDAIRKNPAMRMITVRHEENAAMIASAYNKLTGRIAVCVTIAGPGATNLATGLYDAKEDRASVLSLNGQVEHQYRGPGGFQEIDQDAFFRPITVYNNTVYERTEAVALLTAGLRHAVIRRGVAQLSVPNDVQKQSLDLKTCNREGCLPSVRILPPDEEIAHAATLINQASHPVILAGWGAWLARGMVSALAHRIKAPILTTFRAKGLIPEHDLWNLGILGNVGSAQARHIATECDLLITLGVGFSKMTNVPSDRPMVQVDNDPIRLGKVPFRAALLGNCELVLPRLLPLLRVQPDEGISSRIARMKEEWDRQRDLEADPDAVPIRPPYLMKILSDKIPPDAIISIDVGENGWWFGRNFRSRGQRFIMSGYLATMGFGFPGAIAAKLAEPEKTVYCITGDGGFGMAMADFVTAVKYHLPMVIIIMNNHELGMIRVEQVMEDYPNFGTQLLNPDFTRFAQACGGEGIHVTEPADLGPAIDWAAGRDVPTIIDVETDPRRF